MLIGCFMLVPDGGRRNNLRERIIRKLLRNRVDRNNKKRPSVVVNWFPQDEELDVSKEIPEMVRDPEVPVAEENGKIYINDPDEALENQENHGVDDRRL